MGDWRWELAGLGQTGTEETRNLLDEGVGGDEGIVLAGELLDQLLVLVAVILFSKVFITSMVFSATYSFFKSSALMASRP